MPGHRKPQQILCYDSRRLTQTSGSDPSNWSSPGPHRCEESDRTTHDHGGRTSAPCCLPGAYETIAVVLDLVQPAGARWRHAGGGRNARLDETRRKNTWTRHRHAVSSHTARSRCNEAAVFFQRQFPLACTHASSALLLAEDPAASADHAGAAGAGPRGLPERVRSQLPRPDVTAAQHGAPNRLLRAAFCFWKR
jgi:hypothetical protein